MKNELNNIAVIKVVAILLVVLGHSTIIYSGSWFRTAVIESSLFSLINELIYSFHMPLFVFISGYLFYYANVECHNDQGFLFFVKKKASRLLIPYFAVAILWMIPIRLGINFYTDVSFDKIIWKGIILSTDTGSLWFLLMLFNIFIIFYAIRSAFAKITIRPFFQPFIIPVAVFTCLLTHTFNSKIPVLHIWIPNILQARSTLFYLFYFYLGYLYRMGAHNRNKIFDRKYIPLHIFSSFLLYSFVTLAIHTTSSLNSSYYIREFTKLLLSVSAIHCIYFTSYALPTLLTSIKDNAIFKLLNRHNYSIFLLHAPIIYIITFSLYDKQVNPTYVVSSCFISSILISLLISIAVDKNRTLRPLLGLS